jgi:site-specific DNA recombinase
MILADLTGKRAREYLRVSLDKTGKNESPARQHDENAAAVTGLGLILGGPYAEPHAVSASRWSEKARAEFERLVFDLDGGRFGAEVLVIWESSRGGRSVTDWDRLINACERARVLIYVTTHVRLYDPGNARDRRSLQEDAVDAEYDNAKRRTAVVATTSRRAAGGEAHGRIRFGYARRYDESNRKVFAEELHPAESALVAELYRRLLAGGSLRGIERDWAERGILTRGQRNAPPHPFLAVDLRGMALNAAYAGLRVRQPKGAKRTTGSVEGAVPAKWPRIVDPDVYYAVRALLTDPARRKSRPGGAKHLLGMIAGCGVCGDVLTVRYRNGVRCYGCRARGCVSVPADELDQVARSLVVGWLSREDVAAMLRAPAIVAPELAGVTAELRSARSDLADWRRRAGLRKVSAESFEAVEPVILAEIGRLERRREELSVPPELAGWTGPQDQVAQRWKDSGMPARRTLARSVLSQRRLGTLLVDRVPVRGGTVPAGERVRLEKRT